MRLVVVGGGAGGMSAAAQARRVNPGLEIVVLEQAEYVSAGLCGLPYFVSGAVRDVSALVARTPEQFRSERRIDVRTRHVVEAIHTGARTVVGRNLATGAPYELHYDRMVVATGARPVPLNVPGAEHTYTLRTLADGVKLRQALEARTARTAVVIGGGFIGLEVAEALTHWNLQVTVVEAGSRLLAAFDPWVSERVATELAAAGVRVMTGQTVTGVEPGAVHTKEAGALAADLVVAAVGNRAETSLLKSAERGRSGALTLSRQMQTSLPAVWAAGDCAESRHAVTGRAAHFPLGSVANLHGRLAGEAAAGGRPEGPPLAGTFLLKLFDLALAKAGLSEAEAVALGHTPVTAEVAGPVRAHIFGGRAEFTVRLIADAKTGRLLGGQLAGHPDGARRIDVLSALLVKGGTAYDAAGLDLGYTPPLGVARDPLVQAAQRLVFDLDHKRRR